MALPKQTPHLTLERKFQNLGWTGPWPGGKHRFMRRGTLTVRIPNPHSADIHISLLRIILRQAGISDDEWTGAKG
jgi:predicted RNA binding protein YcfA (HicA-like mRNA interferase family)